MAWLTNYAHRKSITVQDINIDSDESDFPLYVKVGSDIMGQLIDTTNFYDIRFTDSNDNVLDYECEYADATVGHYWVKTNIAASGGASLYVYYENSTSQTDGSDKNGTWNTDFKMVYHMNEDSWTAGNADVLDSTSNGNDGTSQNQAAPTATNALIYKSGVFDGTNDKIDSIAFDESATDWTLSGWMRCDNVTADHAFVGAATGPGNLAFQIWMDNATPDTFAIAIQYGNWKVAYGDTTHPVADTWYHLGIVYDKDNTFMTLYVNGAAEATLDYPLQNEINPWEIGLINGGKDHDGYLDEMRVSHSIRSAGWLKFEYHNVAEGDNELTWGEDRQM